MKSPTMQRFDVLHTPLGGTHLIEASAGTGKTWAIATLFLRLMLERGLGVEQILVVTFTDAAAAELRDRIRERLRAALETYRSGSAPDPQLATFVAGRQHAGHAPHDRERLTLSLRAFDEAPISTIHGFCHRVLHESAFESGVAFETEFILDDEAIVDEVLRDFWAKEIYGADIRFVQHLHREGITPASLMSLARLALRHLDAPIIPPASPVGDQPVQDTYVHARQLMRTLWWRDRQIVTELLLSADYLHKTRYRKTAMPTWFLAMDAFLRHEDPGPELSPIGLEKFFPATLAKATSVRHTRAGGLPPQHPFFAACAAFDVARRALDDDHRVREVELRRRLIKHIRREVPRKKLAAGVQSFDDLLHRLDKALRRRSGRQLAQTVRERYRAALIDEFQDTDPVQYRIFRTLYGGTEQPLFLIGDPKQAIYGFRGADVFTYLRAAQVPGQPRLTMDTNWRSDPPLLRAIERLFDVRQPFAIEDIEFVPVQARPDAQASLWRDGHPLPAFELKFQSRDEASTGDRQITAQRAQRAIPEWIAADISRQLARPPTIRLAQGERPLHAGDIAVLVRKNDQAHRIQAELRALGIPSVVYGDASVFDTPEADELYRVLGAVAEPTHSALIRAAITTELFGVSANTLEAMARDDLSPEWDRWVDDFRRWHEQWVERGFVQMFRSLLSDRNTPPRLLAMTDGERRMTNLLHLSELLHTNATAEHWGPSGLLRWFQQQRHSSSSMAEAAKLRLERDDRAVRLITIHRSKGLEYPVVYCPYLWDGAGLWATEEKNLLFHDPDDQHRLKIDIRRKPQEASDKAADPHIALARREKAAENLRLLYVALTRARHRCVVIWGSFYNSHQSPLGYLIGSALVDPDSPWDPDVVADAVKALDDEAMRDWLLQRGEGVWTLSPLDDAPGVPYQPEAPARVPLAARSPAIAIDRTRRTASFTTMVAHRSHRRLELDQGRDRDENDEPTEPTRRRLDPPEGLSALAEFPRGAKAGNFFHEVMEHLDFQAPITTKQTLIDAKLNAYGYSLDPWSTIVGESVDAILHTPLSPDDPELCLGALGLTQRRNELEFILPTAGSEHDHAIALTRERLAALFRSDGHGLPPTYPDQLERLDFSPLRGFLKGFIDLVFVHRQRWYLVDYKTNYLGDDRSAYAPDRLATAMAEHHYILQYHLYALALVLHLRRVSPQFDYHHNFGGIFYLFLRGMSPTTASTRGVFFDRPSKQRIDALWTLLQGNARS